MRAALPPFCSGVMTTRRMNRPLVFTAWSLTLAVFPRTCATVLNVVPLADTCRSKSRVFIPAPSPPAPAWRTVNLLNATVEPRSTVSVLFPATCEHHLSLLPPDTEPLTAFSGPSLLLHGVEPVAGRFNARLFPVGGGVVPVSYDGGASFGLVPRDMFGVLPMV